MVPTSYPQPGWVEQDAAQIWASTLAAIAGCVGQRSDIAICRPYLGLVVGEYTEWHPLIERSRMFQEDLDETDPWQFKNFLVVD